MTSLDPFHRVERASYCTECTKTEPTVCTVINICPSIVENDNSVGIATRYVLDGPWIESR